MIMAFKNREKMLFYDHLTVMQHISLFVFIDEH